MARDFWTVVVSQPRAKILSEIQRRFLRHVVASSNTLDFVSVFTATWRAHVRRGVRNEQLQVDG